jgi:hypothetical protein
LSGCRWRNKFSQWRWPAALTGDFLKRYVYSSETASAPFYSSCHWLVTTAAAANRQLSKGTNEVSFFMKISSIVLCAISLLLPLKKSMGCACDENTTLFCTKGRDQNYT